MRASAADRRADIFAFGAILYEMRTGKCAFQKPTATETMAAILNEVPPEISPIVPNISASLQRIVHRCDQLQRGAWWEIFGDPQLNGLEDQLTALTRI